MTKKDLIDALGEYPDDMEVVIRTTETVDDGDGWHHDEYIDSEIKSVRRGKFDPDNWVSPSNKHVIIIE